jgi:hypothetical protein
MEDNSQGFLKKDKDNCEQNESTLDLIREFVEDDRDEHTHGKGNMQEGTDEKNTTDKNLFVEARRDRDLIACVKEEEEVNMEEEEKTFGEEKGSFLVSDNATATEESQKSVEVAYTDNEVMLLTNTFPLLESYFNNPATILIFSYLSALELMHLAAVSRGFKQTAMTPLLWKKLIQIDFKPTSKEMSIITMGANVNPTPLIKTMPIYHDNNINNTSNDTDTDSGVEITASRDYYIYKWKGLKNKITIARSRCDGYKKELKTDKKRARVECCLDFTLLRLFVPFSLASIISSMLLVTMWIDGKLTTNVFVCLSPFLAFIVYVFICSGINYVLYENRNGGGGSAVLGGMWANTRGPVHFLFVNIFEENKTTVLVVFVAIMLLLAQILMLGFKLSTEDVTSAHSQNVLQWELVFVPTWLLFILMLITPCLGCINISLFAALFILLWIPFFILFICLSLKLKGMENNTKHRNLRLALIFIPFWILEGVAMLGALVAVVEVVYRLRRDLRSYFSLILERLGELLLCWCTCRI